MADNGKFEIRWIEISKLNPAPYNPRKDLTPDDLEYQKIQKSLNEFGLVDPLVVNSDFTVIGGHQRLNVLKDSGFDKVPCSMVSLDKKKEKGLNIALNKITGEWDYPKLSDLLIELDDGAFDMESIGYDDLELESFFTHTSDKNPESDDPDDEKQKIRNDCENGILFSIGFCDILISPDMEYFQFFYDVFGLKYNYGNEQKEKLIQCILDEISQWEKP